MFKKLTVGKKVVLGFATILILLVVVSAIAFNVITKGSNGFGEYREKALESNLTGRLQANMLMVRMNVKDYLISGSNTDLEEYADYYKKMEGFLKEAHEEIQNPERAAKIKAVNEAHILYDTGFKKVIAFMNQRNESVDKVLNVQGPVMENMLTDIMVSAETDKDLTAAFNAGLAMKHLLLGRLYVMKFLNTSDGKTADRFSEEFGKMQQKLDILDTDLQNPERRKMLSAVVDAKELYTKTFNQLAQVTYDRNKIVSDTLDRIGPEIAQNVEDVAISIKSVQDEYGTQLMASNTRGNTLIIIISLITLALGGFLALIITRSIIRPLNRAIDSLTDSTDQVSSAATQVSSSSQLLAEGASEQAASIEETSSSLEEMASMTKQNAQNAGEANTLMQDANRIVGQANESMEQLTMSMGEISRASEETSKIIKTIDEIAFQTNLLALNAAVEAARAGEAGAGFAVVADEVRNLAMRAAEAAKNTANLIEGTVKKVNDGSDLVTKTNDAFQQVTQSASKVSELVGEIAAASDEQAKGIDQVNIAVTEMDKVVQQNASTAEESASASEEMNAQTEQMQGIVRELIAMAGGSLKRTTKNHPALTTGTPHALPHDTMSSSNNNGKKERFPISHSGEVKPGQVIEMEEEDFKDF